MPLIKPAAWAALSMLAAAAAVPVVSQAAPVPDGVVMPITQSQYPKTYAKWGKAGIDRINAMLRPAAEIMAASPECDRLEIMDLSDMRSVPGKQAVFYGDCKNGKRFYVSEDDVKAKASAQSQNSKSAAVSDATMLRVCQASIANRLNFPSSFSPGWFGTSINRGPVGRAVVSINFEAMNAFGAKLPHTGKCYLDGDVLREVEISPR